jgi:DNA-binding NarL/FixJ family response regulator
VRRNLLQKSDFAIVHPFGLTEREDQILRLIANGLQAKHCAHRFAISTRTVENHIARIISKMMARNMVHAVAIGFASGVLTGKDLEEGE